MIFGRQICKLCKQLPDKLRVHTIPAKYGEGSGRYEKMSNPGTHTPWPSNVCHAKLEFDHRVANLPALNHHLYQEREKESKAAICLRPFVITWTDRTGGPAGTSPGQRPGAEEGLGMWFAGTRAAWPGTWPTPGGRPAPTSASDPSGPCALNWRQRPTSFASFGRRPAYAVRPPAPPGAVDAAAAGQRPAQGGGASEAFEGGRRAWERGAGGLQGATWAQAWTT